MAVDEELFMILLMERARSLIEKTANDSETYTEEYRKAFSNWIANYDKFIHEFIEFKYLTRNDQPEKE